APPGGRRDHRVISTAGPLRGWRAMATIEDMLATRTDAVLLTGVTGFVGTAVALRILERSDLPIVALVRAADRADAAARVRAALADVVEPARLDAYMSRTTALPADLLADG